jgi:hypothetical protein
MWFLAGVVDQFNDVTALITYPGVTEKNGNLRISPSTDKAVLCSGMQQRVVHLNPNDVSEEHVASILGSKNKPRKKPTRSRLQKGVCYMFTRKVKIL